MSIPDADLMEYGESATRRELWQTILYHVITRRDISGLVTWNGKTPGTAPTFGIESCHQATRVSNYLWFEDVTGIIYCPTPETGVDPWANVKVFRTKNFKQADQLNLRSALLVTESLKDFELSVLNDIESSRYIGWGPFRYSMLNQKMPLDLQQVMRLAMEKQQAAPLILEKYTKNSLLLVFAHTATVECYEDNCDCAKLRPVRTTLADIPTPSMPW